MDENRFDAFVLTVTTTSSRRGVLAGLVSGVMAGTLRNDALAKAKKRRKRKKKKGNTSAPVSPPCVPRCTGTVCGDDGCGGTCGCSGGTCTNGRCICPAGRTCGSGLCCPNGQTCLLDASPMRCGSCPVENFFCAGINTLCGGTPGDRQCVCVTAIDGTAHCATPPSGSLITCSACTNDAGCDTQLGLPPGSAVCVACAEPPCPGNAELPNFCLIKGCRDL